MNYICYLTIVFYRHLLNIIAMLRIQRVIIRLDAKTKEKDFRL